MAFTMQPALNKSQGIPHFQLSVHRVVTSCLLWCIPGAHHSIDIIAVCLFFPLGNNYLDKIHIHVHVATPTFIVDGAWSKIQSPVGDLLGGWSCFGCIRRHSTITASILDPLTSPSLGYKGCKTAADFLLELCKIHHCNL